MSVVLFSYTLRIIKGIKDEICFVKVKILYDLKGRDYSVVTTHFLFPLKLINIIGLTLNLELFDES